MIVSITKKYIETFSDYLLSWLSRFYMLHKIALVV